MVELKLCPFCGGEAEISFYMKGESKSAAGFYVECGSCSAGGEPFEIQGEMPDREEYTKGCAVAAWNARTLPTDQDKRGYDALGMIERRLKDAEACGGYPEIAVEELTELHEAISTLLREIERIVEVAGRADISPKGRVATIDTIARAALSTLGAINK